jgi:hypothetical protein
VKRTEFATSVRIWRRRIEFQANITVTRLTIRRGFGLVIGFIELLHIQTRDYVLQITVTYALVTSVIVFTSLLVTASNGGFCPLLLGFPNCPCVSATETRLIRQPVHNTNNNSPNRSFSSLYIPCKNSTENTASNTSSIVARAA